MTWRNKENIKRAVKSFTIGHITNLLNLPPVLHFQVRYKFAQPSLQLDINSRYNDVLCNIKLIGKYIVYENLSSDN